TGRELTSEDLVWSFTRLKDPKVKAINANLVKPFASFETPDKRTVRVQLDQPNPVGDAGVRSRRTGSRAAAHVERLGPCPEGGEVASADQSELWQLHGRRVQHEPAADGSCLSDKRCSSRWTASAWPTRCFKVLRSN